MRVGVAVLAHERLDRVAGLAAHLAGQGAAVAVHLDLGVGRGAATRLAEDLPGVDVFQAHRAEWGRFGLVAASLAAAARLIDRHPDLGHVCLISGACLPLRPLSALDPFLETAGDTDFIESVPLAEGPWVQGGLSEERLTLHHPLSYRARPWLFSAAVEVQRRLGVRRRLPTGLVPHFGAQWWCLSTATLRVILGHPERRRWERFFRRTWIPDESFFQTVVRAVRPDRAPRPPLHLGGFNGRGRPHVFHDDHLDLLRGAGGFFARKIDPDADGLYRHFLRGHPTAESAGDPRALPIMTPAACDAVARRAAEVEHERRHEGRGLLTPGRLPHGARLTRAETACPYAVLVFAQAGAVAEVLAALRPAVPERRLHGRLFAPGRAAEFAVRARLYHGNLPDTPALRDYRPAQFLSRIVWADRAAGSAFCLAPGDETAIRAHLAGDPNARLILVGGEAGATLASLRAPASPRSGGPSPLAGWHRHIALPPDAPVSATVSALAPVLAGDWRCPDGWTVPT